MESTIDLTLDHVMLLARHVKGCDLPTKILIILMELKAPTKSVGFEFLKKSILCQYEDPTRALSGDIYTEITLRYKHHSEEQMDQAIRETIKSAWKHGDDVAWGWYFSYGGRRPARRPSNSEFISRIAYIIELWQGCEKEGCCDDTDR